MKSLLIIGLLTTSVLNTAHGSNPIYVESNISIYNTRLVDLQTFKSKLIEIQQETEEFPILSEDVAIKMFNTLTVVIEQLLPYNEKLECYMIYYNEIKPIIESRIFDSNSVAIQINWTTIGLLHKINSKLKSLNYLINNSQQPNTTNIDSAPPLLLPPAARPIHPIFNGAMWGKR